jgi:salicylate hydroxylase
MQAPLFAREADVNLWLGPRGHLVHYPVRGGEEINVVAILPDSWRSEGWSAPGSPDVVRSAFRDWNTKARDLVASAEHWQRWALMDREPETAWFNGRIGVIGDAAHPMLPYLAQGASQAIEDAGVLARALAAGRAERDPASAFARFEAARAPHLARIQREARRLRDVYHMSGLSGHLRDFAIEHLPGEDALIRRYAWIYGSASAIDAP